MIDLHLSAFAPRWRFLYVVRIDAYITTILPRPIPTTVSAIFMVAHLSRKNKKMINSHVLLPDFKIQGHSVMLPSTLDTEIIYLPLV